MSLAPLIRPEGQRKRKMGNEQREARLWPVWWYVAFAFDITSRTRQGAKRRPAYRGLHPSSSVPNEGPAASPTHTHRPTTQSARRQGQKKKGRTGSDRPPRPKGQSSFPMSVGRRSSAALPQRWWPAPRCAGPVPESGWRLRILIIIIIINIIISRWESAWSWTLMRGDTQVSRPY